MPSPQSPPAKACHLHRLTQSQHAHTLGMLLMLAGDYRVSLQRAPDLQDACEEACGLSGGDAAAGSLASMRKLLGRIGMQKWRKGAWKFSH